MSDPLPARISLPRIIPTLLLKGRGFVKTRGFETPVYLGDPVNIVRLFNDKEADELVILDIGAARSRQGPQFELIEEIVSECFVPVAYGGGIASTEDARRLLGLGVEKVVLNTVAFERPSLVTEIAAICGSQSVVVSLDVGRTLLGRYDVRVRGGTRAAGLSAVAAAQRASASGAGEILLNSIDRDGSMSGYDLKLVRAVSSAVDVPVVACGGAGTPDDLIGAVLHAGASAAAAGSMFVFYGPHRAVLVNMPSRDEMLRRFAAAGGG